MQEQEMEDGPLVCMSIQLGEGKVEKIELREGDDLELIIQDIAQRNGS